MSKTIEEAIHDAIMPLLEENEFVADKKNPHFLDRWYEQTKAAKWGADFALSHQWRSVEDELPNEDEEVLCRMKSNGAIVSGFIMKSKRTGRLEVATSPDFHFEDYGDYEPTHWMPIPELKTE